MKRGNPLISFAQPLIHSSIPEILLKIYSRGVECSQGPLPNSKISLSCTGHPPLLQVFVWTVLFLTHKNQVSSGGETEAVAVKRSPRTAQLGNGRARSWLTRRSMLRHLQLTPKCCHTARKRARPARSQETPHDTRVARHHVPYIVH